MSDFPRKERTHYLDDGFTDLAKFKPLTEVEIAGKKWDVIGISWSAFKKIADAKNAMLRNITDDLKTVDFIQEVLIASLRDPKTKQAPTKKQIDDMADDYSRAIVYARMIYYQNTHPLEFKTSFVSSILPEEKAG